MKRGRSAPRERAGRVADINIGFAWLRLLGACTVVIDHCAPLVEPSRLTIFPASWEASPGYIALMGFFAMSGYQISDSWARDSSWWRFSARRALRLLPPLFVVVALTVLVIGPLFTTWSVPDYFSHEQTWRYLVFTTILFPLQHDLPGVFGDNPYPFSVNGSLWTLPMEAIGYVIVLLVGLAIAKGATRATSLIVLASMLVLDGMAQATIGSNGAAGSLLGVPAGSLVAFLVPFVLGMVFHTYRDRIRFLPVVAFLLLGAWLAMHGTIVGRFLLPLMAAYGAMVLAHHWPQRLAVDPKWYFGSYGMYIWAFPIQQMIVAAGVGNEWLLMALALPASYLCGVASWLFVEAPTQRLRRFLRARPVPAPPAETPPAGQPPGGPPALTGAAPRPDRAASARR